MYTPLLLSCFPPRPQLPRQAFLLYFTSSSSYSFSHLPPPFPTFPIPPPSSPSTYILNFSLSCLPSPDLHFLIFLLITLHFPDLTFHNFRVSSSFPFYHLFVYLSAFNISHLFCPLSFPIHRAPPLTLLLLVSFSFIRRLYSSHIPPHSSIHLLIPSDIPFNPSH